MIQITDADEQLFGTVLLAARIGRAEKIIERLRERYELDWEEPAAGFPYAMAQLAMLQSAGEELREDLNYTEIIETLGDLLYNLPEHWLGRYFRVHARTLLPTEATEYLNYILSERAKAAEDARELLERQEADAWQPWFACTYVQAARLAIESETPDKDRAAELVCAAAAQAKDPVPYHSLGSVMREPFRWYLEQPDLPERDRVRVMLRTLFPKSVAARLNGMDPKP